MHCRDEYQDELDRRAIVRRLDEVTRMLCAVMTVEERWGNAALLYTELPPDTGVLLLETNIHNAQEELTRLRSER